MLSIEVITTFIERYSPAHKIYIAYSGGLDSHVLLHLCASVPALASRLTAVYVHHGLQTVADDWERHCAKAAGDLGINSVVLRVNAQAARGVSPEEAARDARYQAFSELVQAGEVLLLAQHQDDQLETVLLQLFRGAGLKGLAGMPEVMPLGLGLALRPFLNITRRQLEAYAVQQRLRWVEDPSNQNPCFDRNYLRHAVLPLLKQRWPQLASTVARSSGHCGAALEALLTESDANFQELFDSRTGTLDLLKLKQFSAYQQRLLVRRWFQGHHLKMPSEAVLETLFDQIIAADASRNPALQYQGHTLRRYRHHLYCLTPDSAKIKAGIIEWPAGAAALELDGQRLSCYQADSGIDYARWQKARVSAGFRQGGEKIALPGRQGHHALKKLFQEAAIPTWQRERMPLIFMDGQLAAVADLWVSREVWVEGQANAIRIAWHGRD